MADPQRIQQIGAAARAQGLSDLDNLFIKPSLMPAATGEPVSEWLAKVSAWQAGWLAEDLMRGNRP